MRLEIVRFCKNLHGIVFGNMHFCDLLIQIRESEKTEKIYICVYSNMFDVYRHKIFLKNIGIEFWRFGAYVTIYVIFIKLQECNEINATNYLV